MSAVLIGIFGFAFAACLSPTQVTFDVTTDLPCSQLDKTTIAVGPLDGLDQRPPVAVSGTCANGHIGALVVVPSGAKDEEVAARIVTGVGVSSESCGDASASCIVARRALRFLPHEPLTVRVAMTRACIGVACPADETCVEGICKRARVDDSSRCEVDGCDESVLTPPDGGAPDATVDGASDGAVDAASDANADASLDGHADATLDAGVDGTVITTVGELGMSDDATCALTDGGTVKCWGSNLFGELGQGTTDDGSTAPIAIPGITTFARLGGSGSGVHMCALMTDATMRCWGYNGDNELGTGHTNGVDHAPAPVLDVSGVGQLSGVGEIAIGYTHSCARASDGTNVWCWGLQGAGLNGPPAAIAALVDAGVQQVVAGWGFSCVLLPNGTPQCWGDQSGWGPLGPNVPLDAGTATPVTIPNLTGVALLAAGGEHACALVGAARDLWCWGDNSSGQLGNGASGGISTTPVSAGLSGVHALALGINHTCAILSNATVSCWGINDSSQLGRGPTPGNTALPAAVVGIDHVGAIYAGRDHTCARRADDGTLWCWGANTRGQLGDRSVTTRDTPVQVQW